MTDPLLDLLARSVERLDALEAEHEAAGRDAEARAAAHVARVLAKERDKQAAKR